MRYINSSDGTQLPEVSFVQYPHAGLSSKVREDDLHPLLSKYISSLFCLLQDSIASMNNG